MRSSHQSLWRRFVCVWVSSCCSCSLGSTKPYRLIDRWLRKSCGMTRGFRVDPHRLHEHGLHYHYVCPARLHSQYHPALSHRVWRCDCSGQWITCYNTRSDLCMNTLLLMDMCNNALCTYTTQFTMLQTNPANPLLMCLLCISSLPHTDSSCVACWSSGTQRSPCSASWAHQERRPNSSTCCAIMAFIIRSACRGELTANIRWQIRRAHLFVRCLSARASPGFM